jgi:hypothetical protein
LVTPFYFPEKNTHHATTVGEGISPGRLPKRIYRLGHCFDEAPAGLAGGALVISL